MRFSDLYEMAPVGYVTISNNGLILEANLTAALLLGLPRNDLVKQPIINFVFNDSENGRGRVLGANEFHCYSQLRWHASESNGDE
jgi:PAS domain S-box-containing protein